MNSLIWIKRSTSYMSCAFSFVSLSRARAIRPQWGFPIAASAAAGTRDFPCASRRPNDVFTQKRWAGEEFPTVAISGAAKPWDGREQSTPMHIAAYFSLLHYKQFPFFFSPLAAYVKLQFYAWKTNHDYLHKRVLSDLITVSSELSQQQQQFFFFVISGNLEMNLNHCCSTMEKEVNLRHVLLTTCPPRYGKFCDDLAESRSNRWSQKLW
jgi:hypothetical protein